MALKVLYRGHNNTYCDLADAALTQQNWTPATVNDTLSSATKNGVLGGSLAGIRGPGIAGKADATHRPLGWFVNDAQSDPFDNSPAIASGKAVFISVPGSMFKINVYETHTEDGLSALTYSEGDVLYSSQNGLATKEVAGAGNNVGDIAVGIVIDVPTAEDPYLTVSSLI